MLQMIRKYYACYFSFFVNGLMVLVVGAILPFMIEELQISYSIAGGFLTFFAIGNLVASFIHSTLVKKVGRKNTILILFSLVPFLLLMVTGIKNITLLYLVFFMLGISRGTVSIFNNSVINVVSNGKPVALNILHTVFAFGAFLAPFVTSLYITNGYNWRAVVYTVVFLSMVAFVLYAKMDVPDFGRIEQKDSIEIEKSIPYYKIPSFYVIGFLLFFYLGVENCVNGWFITYFKEIGIMSDRYANNLVSVVWLFVMFGRITTASISNWISMEKMILINCTFTGFFFLLMIATKSPILITISIIGLGFFLAGIYPTAVANCGEFLKDSPSGMSYLLAMAALGGIITPQIIGVVADVVGMSTAISVLIIVCVGMILLAILNCRKERNQRAKLV